MRWTLEWIMPQVQNRSPETVLYLLRLAHSVVRVIVIRRYKKKCFLFSGFNDAFLELHWLEIHLELSLVCIHASLVICGLESSVDFAEFTESWVTYVQHLVSPIVTSSRQHDDSYCLEQVAPRILHFGLLPLDTCCVLGLAGLLCVGCNASERHITWW